MPWVDQQHEKAADWMAIIIEKQQQEIQELRHTVAMTSSAANNHHSDASDSCGSAFNSPSKPQTPLSSCGSELLPLRFEDALVDINQYKAMCEKMQRVRSKLVKRDVQVRRVRAQIAAVQEEVKHYQHTNSQLQTRISELSIDLQQESALKEEAVEKAAQSLIQCDRLEENLASLKISEKNLRLELHTQQTRIPEVESSFQQLQHEKAQCQLQVRALSSENDDLKRELVQFQTAAKTEQAQNDQSEQLLQQNLGLQANISSLERLVELQTDQMSKQQQSLVALEAERARLGLESQKERDETKHHVAHLLQANIKLGQQLEAQLTSERSMNQRVHELKETNAMVVEELELLRLKDKHRVLQLRKYDDDYKLLLSSYRELVKASSNMELSRRDLIAALAQRKKKMSVLQSALETLDSEIQNLSKAVAANRTREQSVGRALREYGKRNRGLEDVVGETKKQLRCVLDSLRSSERRKTQAVIEASVLKRDLVVEKCQRSDLLRQCNELERCLAFCHTSATKTQQRAQLLQTENSVLQDAISQLCAYSHELVSSQQTLQRELKQLEVEGKAEPCVFG